MKATSSENIIAADAPTGMGRRYGPFKPPTNAMGTMAAMTVSVASTVGFPTSATARTAISRSEARFAFEITMPDDVLDHDDRVSTRIPIEKISAKNVTRLSV